MADLADVASKIKSIEGELRLLRKELERESTPEEEQVVGIFDGEFMVTEEGKKYQVPPNYASKTKLVPGDQLRLIEEGPQNLFKHIGKVERLETTGVLIERDDEWIAVCDEGEFQILTASIKYFEADVGDHIELLIPANYEQIDYKWGAMVGLVEGGDSQKGQRQEGAREVVEDKAKVAEDGAESETENEKSPSKEEAFILR